MKATQACALFLLILLLCPLAAQAGTLGPALSYNELLALVRQARDGDVLLVSGDLSATDEALVTPVLLEITGDGKATLRHLHVSDSSIVFSNLSLLDSFTVDGVSNIELRTVRVEGASGQYGLSFVGGGTLLIDEDSSVAGGTGATGRWRPSGAPGMRGAAAAPSISSPWVGMRRVNTVTPRSLAASMSPWCATTMSRAMASPSPAPPFFDERAPSSR